MGLASGGQPEVAGHQAGADDCGLLGLDQGDRHPGILQQEVFAEEALGELPVARQLTGLLHQGMNPGDAAGRVLVFDAMTCVGVVFHYLACAAPAQLVDLEEDGVTAPGNADVVLLDEPFDDHRVEDGLKKGDRVGVVVETDAAVYYVVGNEAERLGFWLGHKDWMAVSPVFAGLQVGIVGEVLLRGVVVAAGGFVVAAVDGFVQRVSGFIDIEREASFPPAVWTGVAGRYAIVFL